MKESDEARSWRDLYEFDTPVVNYIYCCDCVSSLTCLQIHIRSSKEGEEIPDLAGKAIKLMHRFTEDEVKARMDVIEHQES